MRYVTNPRKRTGGCLAKRPAEEILFDWFRSGRLVGELSVLIKRRHPDVQAEIDRVYQEHLAQLGKRRRDPGKTIDYFWRGFCLGPCGNQASAAPLSRWACRPASAESPATSLMDVAGWQAHPSRRMHSC